MLASEASRLACRRPCLAKVAQRLAVFVEDEEAIKPPQCGPTTHHFQQISRQHEGAGLLVLAVLRPQPNDASPQVYVGPFEAGG